MRNPLWVGALLCVSVLFSSAETRAQSRWPDAWMEPQDTAEALFESDMYAWRLFVALNWPGDPVKREADRNKPLGAPGPTTWETWRNANSEAPDAIWRNDAADPGPWNDAPVLVAMARSIKSFDVSLTSRRQASKAAARGLTRAPILSAGMADRNHEVRFNKGAYDAFRNLQLFKFEGIRDALRAGNRTLNLPPMAKSIKAQWRKISEEQKPRYHWAEVVLENGTKETFGLVALHISTKDLPNWFWSTFEHIDTKQPGRVIEVGKEQQGWQLPSVDRFACPTAPYTCEGIPANIGLEGTKWANYRLRGTQVDYFDSLGEPTKLSNSVIEEGLQQSSCISCHAKAGAGALFGDQTSPVERDLGPPNPTTFKDDDGKTRFIQTDFVWSLTARPKPANP
jgi:hypothetical protein